MMEEDESTTNYQVINVMDEMGLGLAIKTTSEEIHKLRTDPEYAAKFVKILKNHYHGCFLPPEQLSSIEPLMVSSALSGNEGSEGSDRTEQLHLSVPDSDCSFKWRKEHVKKLLAHYTEHNHQFNSPFLTSKKVWSMIGDKLRNAGIPVTNAQAENKLKNLKKTYRKVKSCGTALGSDRKQWALLDIVDQALGSRVPEVNPVFPYSSSVESVSCEPSPLSVPSPSTSQVPSAPSPSPRVDSPVPAAPKCGPRTGKRRRRTNVLRTPADATPAWVQEFKTMMAERGRKRDEERARMFALLERLVDQSRK